MGGSANCEMIHTSPGEDGCVQRDCTEPATHIDENGVLCCSECAAEMQAGGFTVEVIPSPVPEPPRAETFAAVRAHLGLDEIERLRAEVAGLRDRIQTARNALGHVLIRSDVPPREVWLAAMSNAFDALRDDDAALGGGS